MNLAVDKSHYSEKTIQASQELQNVNKWMFEAWKYSLQSWASKQKAILSLTYVRRKLTFHLIFETGCERTEIRVENESSRDFLSFGRLVIGTTFGAISSVGTKK